MIAVPWWVLVALIVIAAAALVALVWEETARREWRRHDEYQSGWIRDHTVPSPFAPYEGDEVDR